MECDDRFLCGARFCSVFGGYGISTSDMYGYVEVVMKVNMKLNKSSVSFGGKKSSLSTMATDADGNVYKMKSNTYHSYDVEPGTLITFKNVPILWDVEH